MSMKGRFILVWSSLTLCLSGCWDIKDINHRALPVVLGLEKTAGYFHVWLRIPITSGNGRDFLVLHEKAPSISEAIDLLQVNMDRSIDLLHVKMILVSEELAKAGLNEALTFAMRSEQIASKAYLAIVRGKLGELISAKNKMGQKAGSPFEDYFSKEGGWNPKVARVPLWEAFRAIHNRTEDVAIPILSSGKRTPFVSEGSALMKQGKMMGKINKSETFYYNLYQGRSQGGILEILTHGTALVVGLDIDHEASLEQGIPIVQTHVQASISIQEKDVNISRAELQKEFKQSIENKITDLIQLTQKNQSDVLGFGQLFRAFLPQEEQIKWRDTYFPRMRSTIVVTANILDEGNLKR